jgi:hypothetical protein
MSDLVHDHVWRIHLKDSTLVLHVDMGLKTFLRLPAPPNAVAGCPQNKFYRFFGLGDDENRTVSSPYIKPVYLGLMRLLFGTYMVTSFTVQYVLLVSQKSPFLKRQAYKLLGDIMFHSYLGLAVYFLFSGGHTLVFAYNKRNPLSTWPRPLQLAHRLLQTTVLTFPLLCTIIYMCWTLPALPAWHTRINTRWSTVTFYMLNLVFALCELVFSASRPRPWSHLIVVVLILGLYLAFHSILLAATHGKIWIYTVLKFSLKINRGWQSVITVLGICSIAIGSFLVMQLLLWIKCRFLGGLRLLPTHNQDTEAAKLDSNSQDTESQRTI